MLRYQHKALPSRWPLEGVVAKRLLKSPLEIITVTLVAMEDPASKAEEGAEPKAPEKDPILAEINKKIEESFEIFDHNSNKTVDVRYSDVAALTLG